jgi:hypothetical protein
MENIICEYCSNSFKNKIILKNHQNRAKYCITIQQTKNILRDNELKKCIFCLKSYASNTLKRHLDTCKIKKEVEKENKKLKKKEYKKKDCTSCIELNDKNILIKNLEEEIKNLKDTLQEKEITISRLLIYNEIYKEDHECIKELVKQPKNIINKNNKILNIQSSMDFKNVNKLKEIIDDKYNVEYIFEGQKGFAKFAVENILTDDNGQLKYVCTDPSRQIFKYKDSTGDIQKDIEAKKLTNFLADGGLENKACDLAIKWWTSDTGEINSKKCEFLIEKANSMKELKDDNNIFKKELISMTSV